jgi:integrase
MTFKVARLVTLQKPDDERLARQQEELMDALGESADDPGLLYIVNDQTQEIFEPAWLYLKAKFGTHLIVQEPKDPEAADQMAAEPSRWTNRAIAYSLAAWLNFLRGMQTKWSKVSHTTMVAYAVFQSQQPSRHTGRARKPDTVGAKFSAIYGFYNYTNAIGLTDVRWDKAVVAATFKRRSSKPAREDERIHPISPSDLSNMRKELGPLPSELSEEDERSTRDRLLLETGLLTGMREDEICHLRLKAIRSLRPDPARPDALQPVRIIITKGRKPRTVMLPNILVQELQLYAARERKRSLEPWLRRHKDHGYLFVNHPDATRPGGQLKTNSIQRRFTALMRALHLGDYAPAIREGAEVEVWVNRHTFHDTRHTFAVTKYIALKQQEAIAPGSLNHTNPWEIVQWLLGHEDWETTRKCYLNHVGDYAALIGVRVEESLGDADG